MHLSNPLHIISFIFPVLFWGGSYLAIGIAVKVLPPSWSAFIRVLVCFLLIGSYLLIKEKKIEKPKLWLQSMGTGIFQMGIPWIFLFWGEKHITPALAAILGSTVPIFVALFSFLITPDEKHSWNKWLGVLIGFAGVGIIFAPEISLGFSLHFQGVLAVTFMSVCYAIGVLWTRRISKQIRNTINLFYQSLSGGLILLIASLFFELPHQTLTWAWPPYLALIYLGVFSTAIAWLFFFRLIRDVGTIQASAITYCVPIVAILLDFFFWDKWIQLHQVAGACVILIAIFLIHRK